MGNFEMRFSSFSIIISLGIQARENTQSYQIRSKVGVRDDGGNFFRRNDWESDVKDEIEELFCVDERLKIEGAQKCKLKDKDFDYADSGYVKFVIEVEMPESASKSDLKSHYEDKIVTTTTTTSTSTTTPPTQDTTTTTDETTTTETSSQTSTTTASTSTTHKEETTTTTATTAATTTTTTATTTTVETTTSTS